MRPYFERNVARSAMGAHKTRLVLCFYYARGTVDRSLAQQQLQPRLSPENTLLRVSIIRIKRTDDSNSACLTRALLGLVNGVPSLSHTAMKKLSTGRRVPR